MAIPPAAERCDPHSYANLADFRVRTLTLELDVDFTHRVLRGSAELTLDRIRADADTLVLDTRDLEISAIAAGDASGLTPTHFRLAARDDILGSALMIAMPDGSDRVRIHYATTPQASGLQWLAPTQTAGRQQPFLFSQSQAIHARSWIPLQDTPQVRQRYTAHITTSPALRAVMSADNHGDVARDGDYRFDMPQAIPSYLIALAVGDLAFRATGERTGIYAEPCMLAAAAHEFEDTEQMLARCEALFGPYRWGRYDLLIMPPSFPYGGMENPRLTFVSPTVIAGGKSLVSLVAHEMAHSWSGNLVTNALWSDLWLNEGFTDHATFRIVEEVYGLDAAQQERALAARSLRNELATLEHDGDKTLAPDLVGRDPDDALSQVPYGRGALFLAYLEHKFTRPALDAFLRSWFDRHAFRSVRTADFLQALRSLQAQAPALLRDHEVDAWIHAPEMPADTVWPVSDALQRVEVQRDAWLGGTRCAASLDTAEWSTHQWQHFLDAMPMLDAARMAELDHAFAFSQTNNQIIGGSWWRRATANHYEAADHGVEQYLGQTGRMLLITPIYREMATTPAGRERAGAIFTRWRDRYHPIAQAAVERILGETRS